MSLSLATSTLERPVQCLAHLPHLLKLSGRVATAGAPGSSGLESGLVARIRAPDQSVTRYPLRVGADLLPWEVTRGPLVLDHDSATHARALLSDLMSDDGSLPEWRGTWIHAQSPNANPNPNWRVERGDVDTCSKPSCGCAMAPGTGPDCSK